MKSWESDPALPMVVTVRLFATLREGRDKVIQLELDSGSTPGDVIDQLGISQKDVAILLVNGRDGQMDQVLSSQDTVSLFPPVGGG